MKKIFVLMIVFATYALSGCGMQLRSEKAFPVELKKVHFSSVHPYDNLSIQLEQLLKSMNAVIVTHPKQARFTVAITQDFFTYSLPDVSNASLPSAMNYSQSATVEIIDNQDNRVLASQQFRTTQTLTLNAGQIYVQNSNHVLIQQELNQAMISLIYYWLMSSQITRVLYTSAHHNPHFLASHLHTISN